jgi:thioredoxin-related protein
MGVRRTTILLLLLCHWVIRTPQSALGQEVRWRSDYHKARQEAASTGRPLLLDFGTENCVWCKQLDARTFSSAAVAALLNERFIPVKVDAERSSYLAEALHIQSYPTLVFAAPDGKIVGLQEGFLEAGPLREQMLKVLAAVGTPDWMTRDFQEAARAITAADYARAVSLLKGVLEDGKDRPIQAKARQVLRDLERQAAERCKRARDLADKGKTAEAIAALTDLGKTYAGTDAAREGRLLLGRLTSRAAGKGEAAAQRARRARELLEQAREDYRTQQFLCCLDRCETLASGFADLPEGAEAATLAAEIKGNPEWAKQAADQLVERLCLLYLALADSWLKKGQPQQAVFYLERIVQAHPNTRHAQVARTRLSQLQGTPRAEQKPAR